MRLISMGNLIFIILLLGFVPVTAQVLNDRSITIDPQLLIKDIQTASYIELALWLQELGIPPRGNVDQLREQLYQNFSIDPESRTPQPIQIEISQAMKLERILTDQSEDSETKILSLGGNVRVYFFDRENDSTHEITADQITLNDSTNILSAKGGVLYRLKTGDREELFTGMHLYFDVDDWSGLFIDGSSTQFSDSTDQDRESQNFIYSGKVIIRSSDDLVVLKNGIITSSVWNPPAYSIRAEEIFVYAPREWSIRSGVLQVGNIPVFILPGFFHPSESMFFHPSIGTDSRKGNYIQTTYYIQGRKPQEDAMFDFLRFSDDERLFVQEIRGLYLRNTSQTLTQNPPNLWKLYGDYYSRLGFHFGTEVQIESREFIQSFKIYAGLGLTRNLYQFGNGFSPFYYDEPNREYISSWNNPWVWGTQSPVRFGWDFQTAMRFGPISMNIQVPYASDQYYFRDVADRGESINWPEIINFGSETRETTGVTSHLASLGTTRNTLLWQINARGRIPVPQNQTLLSNVQITRLSSDMTFRSIPYDSDFLSAAIISASDSPDGQGYRIDSMSPVKLDFSLQGTLVSLSSGSSTAGRQSNISGENTDPEVKHSDLLPLKPWGEGNNQENRDQEIRSNTDPEITLPELIPYSDSSVSLSPANFRLSYDLANSYDLTATAKRNPAIIPGVVDQNINYWQQSENLRFNTRLSLVSPGNIVEIINTHQLQWNDRNIVFPDFADSTVIEDPLVLARILGSNSLTINQVNGITLSPIPSSSPFSPTKATYNFSTQLFSRVFNGIDDTLQALYVDDYFAWDKDKIRTHSLGLTLGYRLAPWAFSTTLNTILPPRDEEYLGSIGFSYGSYVNLTASSGFFVKDEMIQFNPLNGTLVITPINRIKATTNLNYNLENQELQRLQFMVTLWMFDTSLLFEFQQPWEFETNSGWRREGNSDLYPSSFSISARDTIRTSSLWKNRIKTKLDYNLRFQQGLLRTTDSTLSFDFGFTLGIFRYLDMTFTTRSSNNRMFLYFPGLIEPLANEGIIVPRNIFVDLFRSFYFWDNQARQESYFNLNSLSLDFIHYLGDWNLTSSYSIKPRVNPQDSQSVWDSTYSFTISWLPISEITRRVAVDSEGILSFD